MKKRQLHNNQMPNLQKTQGRGMTGQGDRNDVGYGSKERDRELSVDGHSGHNVYMGNVKTTSHNTKVREESDSKENNYFIGQNAEKAGVSIGYVDQNLENVNQPSINQMSPRMN